MQEAVELARLAVNKTIVPERKGRGRKGYDRLAALRLLVYALLVSIDKSSYGWYRRDINLDFRLQEGISSSHRFIAFEFKFRWVRVMSMRRYRWKESDWREREKRRQKEWKRKREPELSADEAQTSPQAPASSIFSGISSGLHQ
jgi:hypothetical protein